LKTFFTSSKSKVTKCIKSTSGKIIVESNNKEHWEKACFCAGGG